MERPAPLRAKVLWPALLVALTGARLLLAAYVPLVPDEAYYRLWALAPAAGYLDHPPLVALCMRLGVAVAGDTAFGLRLLGPLLAGVGSVCLAWAASLWAGRAAGIRAAVLLNATLAVGLGSLVMTPDTPLVFFMAIMLLALSRLCAGGAGWLWLLAGLAAGLGLDSKYTAALPVAGVGLWLCAFPAGRRWLLTIWPWLGALLAGLVVAPVLWWNAHHHWASFLKQGGRVEDWHPARMLTFMGELVGGQVGLASPLVFVLFAGGVVLLWRRRDSFGSLLLCVILCPALVFVQHAVGARVQANWPVVIYPALALAAARWHPRWWPGAPVLGVLLTGIVVGQAVWAPLRLSPHTDVTLRQMGGWPSLAHAVDTAVPAGLPIIADEYGLAAELAFYMPRRTVLAVEPRWRLFALPHPACGTQGYLLRSHKRADQPDTHWFDVLDGPSAPVMRSRGGVVADTYVLYKVQLRCEGGENPMPDAARLPMRQPHVAAGL